MRIRKSQSILAAIAVCFLRANSWAAAPNILAYQGRLQESGVLVNGNRDMNIYLCTTLTGATCVGTGTQGVSFVNGVFKTTFTVPSTIDLSAGTWYLEVSKGPTGGALTAMSPREQLTSSPFAVVAASAAALTSYGEAIIQGDVAASGTGQIHLRIGATDKLTVANGGNIGIGTTNPSSSKLQVEQTASGEVGRFRTLGAGTKASLVLVNDVQTWGFHTDGTDGNKLKIAGLNNDQAQVAVTINRTNGNVGIGTTNPGAQLDVEGTGLIEVGGSFYLGSNNVAANNYQRYSMGYGVYWNSANANYTVTDTVYNQNTFSNENGNFVWTAHTDALTSPQTYAQWHAFDRMVLTAAGKLGIGTNNPATKLHMSSGTLTIDGNAATSLTTTGNVGIGTTSPGQALEVNGGIRANTATAQPACSATTRGTFWFVQSGAGVKDNVQVCAKDNFDAYAWRVIY